MHKRTRIAILLANYLYMAGVGILSPIYAIYVNNLQGGSAFIASASWSLYLILAGVLMMLLTRSSNKNPRKIHLVLGYSIASLSTFGYLLVTDVQSLFMLQTVHAVGIGILTPTLRTVYSRALSKQQATHGWAMFDGGLFILQGIAALIGGTLLTLFGFTYLFVFMGTLQLVSAFIASSVNFDD